MRAFDTFDQIPMITHETYGYPLIHPPGRFPLRNVHRRGVRLILQLLRQSLAHASPHQVSQLGIAIDILERLPHPPEGIESSTFMSVRIPFESLLTSFHSDGRSIMRVRMEVIPRAIHAFTAKCRGL